jgi:hypothetical protein
MAMITMMRIPNMCVYVLPLLLILQKMASFSSFNLYPHFLLKTKRKREREGGMGGSNRKKIAMEKNSCKGKNKEQWES